MIDCSAFVSYLFIVNDFCQTNYLNIYATDLHQICRVDRTAAVDERSEVSFFDHSRNVAAATIFVGFINFYLQTWHLVGGGV